MEKVRHDMTKEELDAMVLGELTSSGQVIIDPNATVDERAGALALLMKNLGPEAGTLVLAAYTFEVHSTMIPQERRIAELERLVAELSAAKGTP